MRYGSEPSAVGGAASGLAAGPESTSGRLEPRTLPAASATTTARTAGSRTAAISGSADSPWASGIESAATATARVPRIIDSAAARRTTRTVARATTIKVAATTAPGGGPTGGTTARIVASASVVTTAPPT